VKPIKVLATTLLATLTAASLVGASSAMAEGTALCTHNEVPCEVSNTVSHIHETSPEKAKLLTTLFTVECDVLLLGDGSIVLSSSGPVVFEDGFTYTNCGGGGGGCTATEENGPAEIKILKEGFETAKVTGESLIHVVCGSSFNCSYNGSGLVGTAKGPFLAKRIDIVEEEIEGKKVKKEIYLTENGEVLFSMQAFAKEAGGFLCPKTFSLDIVTTPLAPIYISR